MSSGALRTPEQLEAELRHIAFHDPLTRLPNRRLLLDRLGHALQASARDNQWLAVLYLDLDRFKSLNDQYGHDAGDAVLIETARRLSGALRECDTVARFGGDEFVVVLERLGTERDDAWEHAQTIAAKIREALCSEYKLGGVCHRGSTSIGIRLARGSDVDGDGLLKDADLAMYAAKARGGAIAVSERS